jgi:hypothetical protein
MDDGDVDVAMVLRDGVQMRPGQGVSGHRTGSPK